MPPRQGPWGRVLWLPEPWEYVAPRLLRMRWRSSRPAALAARPAACVQMRTCATGDRRGAACENPRTGYQYPDTSLVASEDNLAPCLSSSPGTPDPEGLGPGGHTHTAIPFYWSNPLPRPLKRPQGFSHPSQASCSVFCLPPAGEHEATPRSSLKLLPFHPCTLLPILHKDQKTMSLVRAQNRTDTPVILGSPHFLSAYGFVGPLWAHKLLQSTCMLQGQGREVEVRQIANKSSWEETQPPEMCSLLGCQIKTKAGGVRQEINAVLQWAFR